MIKVTPKTIGFFVCFPVFGFLKIGIFEKAIHLPVKRILIPIFTLLFLGCYQEIIYDENPFLIKKKELQFQSLYTQNPVINLGASAYVFARATGDSLTFSWSVSEGNLETFDTLAIFSHQQEGFYTIECTIADAYGNSETRSVVIHVTEQLVFTGFVIQDTIVPVNYSIPIKAIASGEEIAFVWSADGGEVTGEGSEISFAAQAPGMYLLSCTVTDLAGEEQTLHVQIEVVDGFVFKSLVADPARLPAHDNAVITASALGENLSYRWTCDPPANLLGSGKQIIFNICHADIFTVFCEITDDKGNKQVKSVKITVTDL